MGLHRWRSPGPAWDMLKPRVRAKRHEPTGAEALLWERLRNGQLLGFKFRRQHAVGSYIVDFICGEAGLVVEVDGPIHDRQVIEDRERERKLSAHGVEILRITNEDVVEHLQDVLERIQRALVKSKANKPPHA